MGTIDLSILTPAQRAVLEEARRLDRLARDAHRMADYWESDSPLTAGQRRVAAAYEKCRDAQIALLWTALGRTAPPFSFGEPSPTTTASGTAP